MKIEVTDSKGVIHKNGLPWHRVCDIKASVHGCFGFTLAAESAFHHIEVLVVHVVGNVVQFIQQKPGLVLF